MIPLEGCDSINLFEKQENRTTLQLQFSGSSYQLKKKKRTNKLCLLQEGIRINTCMNKHKRNSGNNFINDKIQI